MSNDIHERIVVQEGQAPKEIGVTARRQVDGSGVTQGCFDLNI